MKGIGGSGPNQNNTAVFYMRKQQILFIFIETVHLIADKHNLTAQFSFRKDGIKIFFIAAYRIETTAGLV